MHFMLFKRQIYLTKDFLVMFVELQMYKFSFTFVGETGSHGHVCKFTCHPLSPRNC